MALYLGGNKYKIIIDNKKYQIADVIVIEEVVLLSNNDYVLKDSNDIYLTSKESE